MGIQCLKFKRPSARNISFNYWLSTPDDFDPSEKLPMIVFLHGAGERGDDVELVKKHGIPKLFAAGRPERVVTLSPQCAAGRVWNTQVYQLMELIEYIAEKYNVDRDRVSLTGLSMGGYGTWMMGVTFPDYFSALAPICGGGMSWLAGALKNVPIRVFHGLADTTVSPANSIEMAEAVNRCGGHAELTLYEGVGHNSWDRAYGETDLIGWLMNADRAHRPIN